MSDYTIYSRTFLAAERPSPNAIARARREIRDYAEEVQVTTTEREAGSLEIIVTGPEKWSGALYSSTKQEIRRIISRRLGPLTGQGGAGRGQGPKPIGDQRMGRVHVRIPAADREYLENLAGGNLSEGIRLVVAAHRAKPHRAKEKPAA